ncbi:MAG TPA: RibD family protein [Micromonosporaceae bacterium]
MTRPHVIVHAMCSLDGRVVGFPADLGLYYETAARLPQQAVLTGSNTMIDGAAREGLDLTGEDGEPSPPLGWDGDDRPWLVIVDGRGRVTRLNVLRSQPYWRDVVILCHQATPAQHLERLRRDDVEHLVVGVDRVDLGEALRQLAERYGVRQVRVDAGGTLNGLLIRTGLVDEISVVVVPYLVGGSGQIGLAGPDESGVRLGLESVRRLRGGHAWLRYTVATGR